MKRSVDEELSGDAKKVCWDSSCSSLMQVTRPSEVPMYLRESEFYQSLNTDDDEVFHVPVKCMKPNIDVDSLQDSCYLLHTIRFWGLAAPMTSIVDFALTQPFDNVVLTLSQFENEFPFIQSLIQTLDLRNTSFMRIEAAMQVNSIKLLDTLNDCPTLYSTRTAYSAAECGSLDSLMHIVNKLPLYKYESRLGHAAAKNGHLGCLQYLMESGFCMAMTANSAAAGDHLDCLKYVLQIPTCGAGEGTIIAAARHNSIASMKYLHSRGYALSESVVISAAVVGALPCLQYCLNNAGECTFRACQCAALCGHLDCLQLLHGRGVALVPDVHETQLDEDAQDSTIHLVRLVASQGHWECVRYLLAHDYPIPVPGRREVSVFELLEESNQFSLLKILVEKGHDVSSASLINFAAHGQLQCLIAAHNCGCEWDSAVCAAAARGGHLECLKYARENGCPWTQKVLNSARAKGHRHIVEYALANNLNVKSWTKM